MDLMELYNRDTIEQDFHPQKLVSLLLDNKFPLYKEQVTFERGDSVILESNREESPYVYIIESGIGALYIGNQIIDFVGEGDFIGLHHSQAISGSQMYGEALTGKMTAWRLSLSEVIAKMMSIQEGYLYHYNYMRLVYERYALKIITRNDTNQQRIESMLQVIVERFVTDRIDSYAKIPRCFTRRIMANYGGISNTTLSGVLTQLEKEGNIIFKSRDILVLNNLFFK
ncbi:Crp/Fnr family transcriptional regulator [Listeria grandensis]|uniref:Crp/Fnr family transcriptional regulator n=1 Tax=Listeria grandensis TaxID=1494963 RepID=UPI00164DAC24|nr:Crp/Fnr family transcriptional regulator [Listeria grandensis]MBC6316978.1 Crp/Fnr family transcriptional regulator [Listeria grandensis]